MSWKCFVLHWQPISVRPDASFLFPLEICIRSSGITRITDNRHHPTDVLSGAILGTVVAIIAVGRPFLSSKKSF